MPQIAQLSETYASQVFWLLLFFGFIFFVIGRGMVPKVMATVEARGGQIAADLAAAEGARKAADAEEESWRLQSARQRSEAQTLIGNAKLDAAKATELRLADANRGIDAQVAAAEAGIATARSGALTELDAVAADAAIEIVARLSGLTVDAKAAGAAVKEALNG
ncbi:MAG: ATPase [Novosphingobium sp.]